MLHGSVLSYVISILYLDLPLPDANLDLGTSSSFLIGGGAFLFPYPFSLFLAGGDLAQGAKGSGNMDFLIISHFLIGCLKQKNNLERK